MMGGSSDADNGASQLGPQGGPCEACSPWSIDLSIWGGKIETYAWTLIQFPKAGDAAHQLL